MDIKALKSGRFAHPEPSKPHVNLKEGRTYDVDGKMAASLIECEWGEIPADKPLSKMNKTELIEYAVSNDIELDLTATNADMVLAITWAETDADG